MFAEFGADRRVFRADRHRCRGHMLNHHYRRVVRQEQGPRRTAVADGRTRIVVW